MMIDPQQRGSIVLEAIVAIGIAALFISAVTGVLLASNASSGKLAKEQQAALYAVEGMEALRTLAFTDLTPTVNGGLSYDNATSRWLITGTPDSTDGFTRSITISEVQRDENCLVTESGGAVDPDSLLFSTTLSWTDVSGAARTVTHDTLRTNWESPSGECFAEEQADRISVDVSGGSWNGSKQLDGILVTNNGTSPVTVDQFTLFWTTPTGEIQQVFFSNTKIWSNTGPGTPSGTQPSGTTLDTVNGEIAGGSTEEFHKIQFTNSIQGDTLTLELTFSDGSVFTSDPFTP